MAIHTPKPDPSVALRPPHTPDAAPKMTQARSDSAPTALPATLASYQRAAREGLARDIAAYFLEGAGQQSTLQRNLADLEAIRLRPRMLRDLRGGGTGLSLLGQRLAHPIIAAPMAYMSLLHPDGEAGLAAAVTAQSGGMVLSAQASQPMEAVHAQGEGCGWFQLYWQVTPEATLALANRAASAGFSALVLTVDAPVNGVRDAEIEAGFALPPQVRAVNLDGMPTPRLAPLDDGESLLFDRVAHLLPTWEDVAWLCKNAPLPVLLKGILDPEDAHAGIGAGAAGIIVSNHGGRALDGALSSITALPDIVARVEGAVPVLMDGGIRRGVDVLKALALGATAVLVGRPLVHGLAVAGAQGASHVLRLLRDELEVAMALTGCATLKDITRDRVVLPAGFSPS
ncbi:alpha-hydroxy acid oxidase [Primorskyibacter sedentarius]|uniref:alpha-hydroxy acid oxidase n=1 Tax=Primorskyibacter sedentarius TaxID=745311 RepID=UPI003EC0B102